MFSVVFASVMLICSVSAMVSAQTLNTTSAENIGIYHWTWSDSVTNPKGVTFGVAFNGYADPKKALAESKSTLSKLAGNKWISLGGGDSDGRFTKTILSSINTAINAGNFKAYYGIVFDVEEGDSGLAASFKTCFQSCKNQGLDVMVTVSHSAPYGISDAASLMNSFFKDGNIHFLSPQLYTTGEETSNDYTTAFGVQWSSYGASNSKAAVIPSIVKASLYDSAAAYFAKQGVTTKGFVQWSQ